MQSELEAIEASNSIAYGLLIISILASFANYVYSGPAIIYAIALGGALISAFDIGLTYSLTRPWRSSLSLRIRPSVIREGEYADISLRIESPVLIFLQVIRIKALTDNGLTVEFQGFKGLGNSLVAEGTLKGYVGSHEICHVVLRTSLIGGLSTLKWRLRINRLVRITPSLRYYRGMSTHTQRNVLVGYVSSLRPGQGTQPLWIREYSPGDELRRVDWKSTARLRKYVVKVFESESFEKVLIAAALTDDFFVSERPAFPHVAEELLRLSSLLIRSGFRVLALIITEDKYYVGAPSSGSEGLGILTSLLSSIGWPTRPNPHSSVTRLLPWLIGRLAPMLRGGCNTLVITSPQSLNDIPALGRVNSALKALTNNYLIYLTSPELIRLLRGELVPGDLVKIRNKLLIFNEVIKVVPHVKILKSLGVEDLLADLLHSLIT